MAKSASKKQSKVERSVKDIEEDLQLPSSSEEEVSGESDAELSEGSDSDSDSEPEFAKDEDSVKKVENASSKGHKVIKIQNNVKENKQKKNRGVIYIGRLPSGFQEEEMKKYFNQFGDITRLRLSRNKKTGKTKHYGFIEFEEHAVAKIAAETMNNYLLFGHLIQCHVMPKEDVHEDLFKGASSTFKTIPWTKISQVKHDGPKSKKQWEKLQKKHKQKMDMKKQKLKAKGIEFDLSSIV